MSFIAKLFRLRHANRKEEKVFRALPKLKIVDAVEVAEVRHIPAPPKIKIKDVKEDVPEFKKVYSGVLSNNACIELDVKYCDIYKRRSFGLGTLTQPNGSYVFFDVDRVADKILDPQLVPLINDFIKAVKELDKQYAATAQNSFMDKMGNVWLLEAKPTPKTTTTTRGDWLKLHR